jgi:hypothetical protein
MNTSPIISGVPAAHQTLGKVHALLAVQSIVVVLVSINRLSTLTTSYVSPNEFLRWVDLNNMLILPLISLIAFYLLKQHLEYDSPARGGVWHRALSLTFVIGVYLLGAGYGDHEVTNYLHTRFCPQSDTSSLCRIIVFNDDEFSHWVFFTGFVLVNVALMLLQIVFPQRRPLATRDGGLLVLNGLFIGLGIFANLAFEEIGLDLYIVAFLAVVALGLFWRRGTQPLVLYYATAYSLGLIATAIYKGVVG